MSSVVSYSYFNVGGPLTHLNSPLRCGSSKSKAASYLFIFVTSAACSERSGEGTDVLNK